MESVAPLTVRVDRFDRAFPWDEVRAETEELLYFVLVNSLFSLMLETEPSNHWHSILIPKAYLK